MIKLFERNFKEIKFDIAQYQLNLLPLDNFSSFGVKIDGNYFQTAEHAFQYLKFNDEYPEIANKIKAAFSPNEARDIAQKYKHLKPKNWSDVKYANMEKIFEAKSKQNPIVRDVLIATKDYLIIEFCIDEDTDWGVDANKEGQNNLGKIWMKVRDNTISI